jgi:hypothetical protein
MNRWYLSAPLALAVSFVAAPSVLSLTQSAQDKEAVRQVGLDYVEGVYNVQPERIERSVHPSLVKRGFHKKDAAAPYAELTMSYDQLVNLAKTWNKDGKRDTKIKNVEILDMADQTAVVKITASWGIDYMLVGKYDGRWKISQILWQSPPPRS